MVALVFFFSVSNSEMQKQMNGRLAMMGFFAAVINYGIIGWIIPGIV